MKRLYALLVVTLLFGAKFAMAAAICPVTSNTNTDCGYILTIGPGGSVSGAAVANANPYDGSDDALIGVVNNSGATFTGSIALSGTGNGGGIFGFDGDGICTFIGPGASNASSMGTYCSSAATSGADPEDYAGPLNTFSNITSVNAYADTGDVDISGLAAGATTFFSLESAPDSITLSMPPVVVGTPEPASLVLLASGLAGVAGVVRRRLSA